VKSYILSVVIEEDAFEDGTKAYHVHCPGLKGCRSWGRTIPEALSNIQEAAELYIDDLLESGESIPMGPENGVTIKETPSVVVNL